MVSWTCLNEQFASLLTFVNGNFVAFLPVLILLDESRGPDYKGHRFAAAAGLGARSE